MVEYQEVSMDELKEREALEKIKEGLRLVTKPCPCGNSECDENLIANVATDMLEDYILISTKAYKYAKMMRLIKELIEND